MAIAAVRVQVPSRVHSKQKALYRWIRGFLLVLDQIGATVLNSFYPLSELRFRGSTFLGILKQ